VTKKKIAADPWFQMFAAVAGTAAVISMFGTVSTRHNAPLKAPAPAATAAPAAPVAAPAPAAGPSGEAIAPAPKSSSDLATYDPQPGAEAPGGPTGAAPPAPDATPPPRMTLTGTGVGNTQGIVGAPQAGGGAVNGFLAMFGVRQQQAQAVPQVIEPPYSPVVPQHKGVFRVGPAGAMGADTSSVRDAVFSAASGDLILVEPGTYDGSLNFADKNVRIRGVGKEPGSVVITFTGPGSAIGFRAGTLDLQNLRVVRGAFQEFPLSRPGAAVHVAAGVLTMRNVELHSDDAAAPPLLVEHGDKQSTVMAAASALSGSRVNLIARGPAKVKFSGVTFDAALRPIVAWLDAVIELKDCRFLNSSGETAINAYENARVIMTGKQKVKVQTERGKDATSSEEIFGATVKPAITRSGFARDIFRRGRRVGDLP